MEKQQNNPPTLSKTGTLGAARLTVRNLAASAEFYTRVIGLEVVSQSSSLASMGVSGDVVLELEEDAAAPLAGTHAGLFHVALLFPSRLELARACQRIIATRTMIEGAADHGTHEAIYLRDPDENGLELACDWPKEQWPTPEDGKGWGQKYLAMKELLSLVGDESPKETAGEGLRVGHMHLHVGDLNQALTFYRDLIGFEVQTTLPTAAFVSMAGYHHHLGLNVRKGLGVPPAPERVVGLKRWTIELGTADDLSRLASRLDASGYQHTVVDDVITVSDPWNIEMRFEVAKP